MSPLVAEFSIWVHDEFGRDSIGPESARIDGSWPPAQARYEKLLGDWLLLWPHAALSIDKVATSGETT